MSTTAPPAQYQSGHCSSAHHGTCRGVYGSTTCACGCHEQVVAALALPIPAVAVEQLHSALGAAYGSELLVRQDEESMVVLRRRGAGTAS